jgi:TolB-like protein
MITVQLLGGACLRSAETPIGGPPAQRHRIALLTLVVASWPKPLSRDRAMALLWPEPDAASGRRLLNLAVHVLRSALGEACIASMGDTLLFVPGVVECDLHELRAAIAAHEADRIVARHTGSLLDGFHLADSAEFGHWLEDERRELTQAYVDALRTLAASQTRAGDVHAVVRTCRRLVATDSYSALHAQALMRALDAAGDRAGAIQYAADHAQRLRRDLELPPEPSVAALAEQLRGDPGVSLPASSDGNRPRREAIIAVLPFLNLGRDADADCFAEGMTEDVITHLAKLSGLRVIAMPSVARFKARQQSLRDIGAALGTTIVLDGSVRRAGDRVRIVAKLIDVEADRHLWAESYDRELTDIFAIQTDVALRIAAALEAELSAAEQSRVRKQPTQSLKAYQLFLLGRRSYTTYTMESMFRAIEYYDHAIAQDARFALAWARKGLAYTELSETGLIAPSIGNVRAAEATATALRLDPELSHAYCTLGHLRAVTEFDWAGAEDAFKRALELSPSNADAYNLYGRLCGALERYDEAIAMQCRAQELDPLAHRLDVVTSLMRAGRYEQAIERGEAAIDVDANYDRALATLGWAYFLSGRTEHGIATLERAVAAAPGNTMWIGQLGEAYALAGDTAKARTVLHDLTERAATGFVSPYHFAYVHTGLGEAESAIDCLERAVAERTGPAYGIKGSFMLTALHSHPRFQALLRRIGLG